MMMRRLMAFGAAAALGLVAIQKSSATVAYQYITDMPTYGGTAPVTVNLYLQENVGASDKSLLGDPAVGNGLFSAGVEVKGQGGASITGLSLNKTDFGGPSQQSVGANDTTFSEAQAPGSTAGVKPGNGNGASSSEVFLGSLTVQPAADGSVTNFTVGPIAGGGNTLDGNGDDLDSDSTSPAFKGAAATPFTVGTGGIPEPASMGVLAIGGLALLARRRK